MRTARLKVLEADPRKDDVYLYDEGEPKALGPDNCMREGIETKPLPLLGIDNIELISGMPLGNFSYGYKTVGINSSRQTSKGGGSSSTRHKMKRATVGKDSTLQVGGSKTTKNQTMNKQMTNFIGACGLDEIFIVGDGENIDNDDE